MLQGSRPRTIGPIARSNQPKAGNTLLVKYRIPIDSLKAVINPLAGDTWRVDPIDPQEVMDAAQRGETCDQSWATLQATGLPRELHRTFHVMRLAWLVNAPRDPDDIHKIVLCVSPDKVWFYDGNHRAAAAIVRSDPVIELHIIDGGGQNLAVIFPGLVAI